MKLGDRLTRARHADHQESLLRVDVDVFTLSTNLTALQWEPGGLFLVEDEVRRTQFVDALVRHSLELERQMNLARGKKEEKRQSAVRRTTSTAARALNIEDVRRLRIDCATLRRMITVGIIADNSALTRQVIDQLRKIDTTLVDVESWLSLIERRHRDHDNVYPSLRLLARADAS